MPPQKCGECAVWVQVGEGLGIAAGEEHLRLCPGPLLYLLVRRGPGKMLRDRRNSPESWRSPTSWQCLHLERLKPCVQMCGKNPWDVGVGRYTDYGIGNG